MIHKKLLFCSTLLFFITTLYPQEQQVLRLTPEQIESLFLEQNLELLAGKFDVGIADAAVIQAKLWDNPVLSFGNISFWSTESQRAEDEVIPPLFGKFGRNTEFSIELSQWIQTAGKRRKWIKVEEASREMAICQFENMLRGLKVELRKWVNELIYSEHYFVILQRQKEIFLRVMDSYRGQVQQNNRGRPELFRLESAILELETEENEYRVTLNRLQKELKTLLNIDPDYRIEVHEIAVTFKNPEELSLENLIRMAEEFRPDLKLSRLQTEYFKKSWDYHKAQRSPDIELSLTYDRYGGVWKNFIGLGISFGLPVVNRNQGEIKMARLSHSQSLYRAEQQQQSAHHEIKEAFDNYWLAYDFYRRIHTTDFISEMDEMQEIYTRNLLSRNIGMTEYIDFMEAYKSNQQTLLSMEKNVFLQFEELQYSVGIDIK